MLLTCPDTANPSASNDVASQTCKQTWKAAMDVEPCFAANEAAKVTHDVAAVTLINSRNPDSKYVNTSHTFEYFAWNKGRGRNTDGMNFFMYETDSA